MKLNFGVLAFAASALLAVTRPAYAGDFDGPCTIVSDLATQRGRCPQAALDCMARMSLAPANNAKGFVPTLPDGCMVQPAEGQDPSTLWNAAYTGNRNDRATVLVSVGGNLQQFAEAKDRSDLIVGIVAVGLNDDEVVCVADARVVSGTCMRSDIAGASSDSGDDGFGPTYDDNDDLAGEDSGSAAAAAVSAGAVAAAAAVSALSFAAGTL